MSCQSGAAKTALYHRPAGAARSARLAASFAARFALLRLAHASASDREQAEVPGDDGVPEEEGAQRSEQEVRTERDEPLSANEPSDDPADGADGHRQEDADQQTFPAQERAQHGSELHVAEA